MLRLPIQQALKALRNPIHNSLHHPLRHRLQAPSDHVRKGPFSGPPSYATISRRDIHDIGAVGSNHYDVLSAGFTDVADEILRTEIAELVGIPYLSRATQDESNKKVDIGSGFLYGDTYCPIFPCVVKFRERAHWVFFIVASGSPGTFLSAQTCAALGIESTPTSVTIAGYDHHYTRQSPEDSHFDDLNLLGQDFCALYNTCLVQVGRKRSLDVIFGWTKWEVKPKLGEVVRGAEPNVTKPRQQCFG